METVGVSGAKEVAHSVCSSFRKRSQRKRSAVRAIPYDARQCAFANRHRDRRSRTGSVASWWLGFAKISIAPWMRIDLAFS